VKKQEKNHLKMHY